jgi:hypothetical protein
MFSADDSKQKKSRRVEETATRSSAREPVRNLEPGIPKRRSNLNLLTIPLHAPVQDSTPVTQTVDSAEAKPDYQGMSYPEKLNAAIQMVPELLVGDAKALLDDFPAFIAQMVVVGGIFAGLQATPAGPFIDLALFAIMGVEATTKLLGFLYKCHTAQNEKDLREAAEDLKVFIEIVGLAAATKLLQMAGRALKNLSGEAKAVKGQEAIPRISDDEAAKIVGGSGKAKPPTAQETYKAQSHQNRLSRYEYSPNSRTHKELTQDIQPKLRTGETEATMQQRVQKAQAELNKRSKQQYQEQYSEQRAQKTASQADQPLENPLPNASTHGHGHVDHGYQTTDLQQGDRIRTGITPSGRSGAPVSKVSKFHSATSEIEALGRGRKKLKDDIANGLIPQNQRFPDPATGKPTYVNPVNGAPTRHKVTVTTDNPKGFGYKIVKDKDPVTGQVQRNAAGQPLTIADPTPIKSAIIVWEYVPSKATWRPLTYYPK